MKPELQALCEWLESRAEETMRQATSRRDGERAMRETTGDELKQARIIANRMSGIKLPAMSTAQARSYANTQGNIAAKLEAEARQLSAWADLLRRLTVSGGC